MFSKIRGDFERRNVSNRLAHDIFEGLEQELRSMAEEYGLPSDATLEQINNAQRRQMLEYSRQLNEFYRQVDAILGTKLGDSAEFMDRQLFEFNQHILDRPENVGAATAVGRYLNELRVFHGKVQEIPIPQVREMFRQNEEFLFGSAKSYCVMQNRLNNRSYPTSLDEFLKQ